MGDFIGLQKDDVILEQTILVKEDRRIFRGVVRSTEQPVIITQEKLSPASLHDVGRIMEKAKSLILLPWHANIAAFLGCFVDKDTLSMVWEFDDSRFVSEAILKNSFSGLEVMQKGVDMCNAAIFLNEHAVYEYALRLDNLILKRDGTICMRHYISFIQGGGSQSSSPENVAGLSQENRSVHDKMCVYDIGCVLWMLLAKKMPKEFRFEPNIVRDEYLKKILSAALNESLQHRPSLKEMRNLLFGMEINKAANPDILSLKPRGFPGNVALEKCVALSFTPGDIGMLPSELFMLTKLTNLWLSGNKITSIPREISSLSELLSLNVSSNYISFLPSEISLLSRLTHLNACGNRLSAVPDMRSMGNLQIINLQQNRFTSHVQQLVNSITIRNQDLDLSSKRIQEITPELMSFPSKIIVNMSSNMICDLPGDISKLQNVVHLDVSNNILSRLPPEISALLQLTALVASSNKIAFIPAEISALSKLQHLFIQENQISRLPNLRGLASLVRLGLEKNNFTTQVKQLLHSLYFTSDTVKVIGKSMKEIPPEFMILPAKPKVELSNIKMASLPSEISKLFGIVSLDVSKNQLSTLPLEISTLTQLEILDVSHNKLSVIPAEISSLVALKQLLLGYNQINKPLDTRALTNLHVLNLQRNKFTTPLQLFLDTITFTLEEIQAPGRDMKDLVPELYLLPAKPNMDFSNNRLSVLPATMIELSELSSIDLSRNRFTSIPAILSNLKKLAHINFSHNLISSLDAIIEFTGLSSFNFSNNRIHQMPAGISRLAGLTSLNVSGNRLYTLPSEIAQLVQLVSLDITNNIILFIFSESQ